MLTQIAQIDLSNIAYHFGYILYVHIDERGNLIERENHKFVYVPERRDVMKVEVKVPFSVQPVKDILPVSVICNDVSYCLRTVS